MRSSADANHTFKPDPRAYQLGVDRLHIAKEDIVFAAFGGWDAVGAKSFGYPATTCRRCEPCAHTARNPTIVRRSGTEHLQRRNARDPSTETSEDRSIAATRVT